MGLKNTVVMVFGVFDVLHAGHRAFLERASRQGGKLIVIVARDHAVRALKKKAPRERERTRLAKVARLSFVARATLGDLRQGSYRVIARFCPTLVCVGHDQRELESDLRKRLARGVLPQFTIVRIPKLNPTFGAVAPTSPA